MCLRYILTYIFYNDYLLTIIIIWVMEYGLKLIFTIHLTLKTTGRKRQVESR